MISVRLATVIAVAAFAAGGFVMSPVPQAIAAVIATDVQCTGCVGTADIGGNAVTAAKIKDGEVKTEDIALNAIGSARIKDNDVKAQDLAPDSVGASELQGVTKLIFAKCTTNPGTRAAGSGLSVNCNVPGAAAGDLAVATSHLPPSLTYCFVATTAGGTGTNVVNISLANFCSTALDPGTVEFSIIVYKQ